MRNCVFQIFAHLQKVTRKNSDLKMRSGIVKLAMNLPLIAITACVVGPTPRQIESERYPRYAWAKSGDCWQRVLYYRKRVFARGYPDPRIHERRAHEIYAKCIADRHRAREVAKAQRKRLEKQHEARKKRLLRQAKRTIRWKVKQQVLARVRRSADYQQARYAEPLCESYKSLRLVEEAMTRMRRVDKLSGTINLSQRRKYARTKIFLQRRIARGEKQFRAAGGKLSGNLVNKEKVVCDMPTHDELESRSVRGVRNDPYAMVLRLIATRQALEASREGDRAALKNLVRDARNELNRVLNEHGDSFCTGRASPPSRAEGQSWGVSWTALTGDETVWTSSGLELSREEFESSLNLVDRELCRHIRTPGREIWVVRFWDIKCFRGMEVTCRQQLSDPSVKWTKGACEHFVVDCVENCGYLESSLPKECAKMGVKGDAPTQGFIEPFAD